MRSAVTGKPVPLLGGVACLDFVNTIDPRYQLPQEDFLTTYDELTTWGRYAGLLSAAEARAMRVASARPALASDAHRRAVTLRDAVYVLFRRGPGLPGTGDPLTILNHELTRAAANRVLMATRDAYRFAWRESSAHEVLLGKVACSASDLLTSPELYRVRECEGEGCGWLFLDTSKARRRRWCSMAICGNRAKVRRHRERRRAATPPASGEGARR